MRKIVAASCLALFIFVAFAVDVGVYSTVDVGGDELRVVRVCRLNESDAILTVSVNGRVDRWAAIKGKKLLVGNVRNFVEHTFLGRRFCRKFRFSNLVGAGIGDVEKSYGDFSYQFEGNILLIKSGSGVVSIDI